MTHIYTNLEFGVDMDPRTVQEVYTTQTPDRRAKGLKAINDYEGGMRLVSHDFRLIQQVAQEIWVCEKQTITKLNRDSLA